MKNPIPMVIVAGILGLGATAGCGKSEEPKEDAIKGGSQPPVDFKTNDPEYTSAPGKGGPGPAKKMGG